MTELLFRGTALGLLAGGLAACAMTPSYPTAAPEAAAPAAPAYTPPPAAVPPPPPPPPEAAPGAPPPAVESQPLAPIAPPQSNPPPSASAATAPPPPVTMAPVPDYGREAARQRAEAPRYIATGKVVEAHRMFRDYVVRKGDHLDAIARDLETTRATLLEANHLKKPNDLRPGQHLKVPIEKAYVAAPGDTVAAVARRFDVGVADLADLNAISEDHRIRPGEELALPSSFHDRGPVQLPPARSYARYTPPPPSYGGYPSPGAYTPTPYNPPAGGVRPPAPYPSVATAAPPPTRTDSQVMAAGKGRFVWPVRGEILSAFGVQDVDRRNDGVDIRSPMGTAVHAAAAGEVV